MIRSSSSPIAVPPSRLPFWSSRGCLWGFGLVLAVLLAYGPVWRAGFVWDDRSMLTANPCIAGPLGLRQIWTTHFADTCPLTLSALWLEHACWDFSPLPYHVVNVLLHAAGALMLWRVLRCLRVPGAWLGAALWALHPVGVASVAWVAELKNTLSGLFFLVAVFFFLRWSEAGERSRGSRPWYGLSLLGAALAMASKSSTVVLPLVLGLCAWWMEGRVRWRWVLGLGPLVLLAAAASALTLWTQRLSLAQMGWALPSDGHWERPWPDRLVAAGEAVWFYLGKLLWPHPLVAVYPRWQIHSGRWSEWLPLLFVLVALSFLWSRRGSSWGRPCFFAFAYFLGALLPALGLLDGTDFRYALVFDHFQYLASMGPLALAGAGAVRLAQRTLPGWQWAAAAGVLLVLGTLSWQRSEVYRDEETFWIDTVAKNPDCWLGRSNLGSALLVKGRPDAAREQYEKALETNPRYAVAHDNLGVLFLRQGKIEEAIAQIEQAVALDPHDSEAHSNLGNAFLAKGRTDEAIDEYERALTLQPDLSFVYFNLGNARYAKGQVDEAIVQYEKALAINANYAEAHANLGNAFFARGQLDEAIVQYEKALAINANYAEAHYNLGLACLRTARFDEAVIQFQEALRLAPDYPNVERNLAAARMLARRAQAEGRR